jgi:transposase-like protein
MSHAQQLHNRRYLDGYMQIINRAGLPDKVKAEVCQQVHATVLATVQWTIEQALEEEVTAYVGCQRYVHLPQGRPAEHTRSGGYRRALLTQYAGIPALRVPKLRRGNKHLCWQTITRYERCWGALLDQQVLSYCLGLSLRDLQEAMRLTLGEVLSLEACNRLVLGLEARVEVWKTRRLAAPPPIVMVDGCWVKIAYPSGEVRVDALGRRRAVKRKQKRVVLTALGVWPDGHWEIVYWKIAAQEDAETWNAFIGELYNKGITEETTQLVISDGTKGLPTALERHLPCVPHQRCLFHKIKNIADHLRYTDLALDPTRPPAEAARRAKQARKKAILAEAGQVYSTDVATEIRARAEGFRTTWGAREPQAVENFFVDFEQTLGYLTVDFPRACVSLIRTTNLLERFHKEIRRKQRDIGMFQSEQGCEAVWYLIATRETAKQQAALGLKR